MSNGIMDVRSPLFGKIKSSPWWSFWQHDYPDHAGGSFMRFEDKYVLPARHMEKVKELMKSRFLNPSPPLSADFYGVESIYFDSPEFQFFQDHFLSIDERCKVRIRRYYPDINFQHPSARFLELKTKADGISKKLRLEITPTHEMELMRGVVPRLDDTLVRLNPDISPKKIKKRLKLIRNLMEGKELQPTLAIRYERLGREKGELRLTLDRNIRFSSLIQEKPEDPHHLLDPSAFMKSILIKEKYRQDQNIVLEVKHLKTLPSWLNKFITSLHAQQEGFSKYCWAVGNLIYEDKEDLAPRKVYFLKNTHVGGARW